MIDTRIHISERKHDSMGEFVSLKGPIVSVERGLRRKPSSIVMGESIRGHYEPRFGDTSDCRGIRIVEHQEYSNSFINRGKKYLGEKDTPHDRFTPSVKQFHGIANLPSAPASRISQHWTGKTRVNPVQSDVFELEQVMNRKQRILTYEEKRNGLANVRRGDKYYKSADRERDFYKKGGLIPGSCISIRKSGKLELNKKDENAKVNLPTKSHLTFEQKNEKAILDNELQQLHALNNPVANRLGLEEPSWERKTGFYMVMPEDENY
jgi:hypothetical protein